MRYLLIIGVLFVAISASAQGFTISPLNPVATPGGSTITFTCTVGAGSCSGGTGWSCTGCAGSINSGTGVYTPPATAIANQSIAGYQLLPNNHIFNADISGLAAASNSATVMANVGTASINFLASFPVNYTNGSTPTQSMSFFVNSAHNGTFERPLWPTAGIEGKWFDAISENGNVDHHMITANYTNGNIGETYQYYAQAPLTSCTVNSSNSVTCTITPTNTSQGFIRAAAVGAQICVGSFTGGDTYLNICPIGAEMPATLTAATLTTITFNLTHGAATTSTTGQATLAAPPGNGTACSAAGACNSQDGILYTYKDYALPVGSSADAAGLAILPLMLRSQELVNAVQNGTAIKHALRMTLSPGPYICGTNVVNSCCIGAACNATGTRHIWPAIAEALNGGGTVPYGARFRLKAAYNISGFSAGAQVLLTTLKHYGIILADGGANWQVNMDYDNLPAAEVSVLNEINNALIPTSNWEAVDDSSLMETASSGAVNTAEYVCFNSSSGTACTNVAVQGTAINVASNNHQYYIMAGTPQQTLPFYSNAGAFTCAMSPSVGSLTSGCLYTPPASEASVTKTTVTATSSVNGAVTAQMIVYVTPSPAKFIQATADFTDSHGAVWYSGGAYGIGMSNVPSWQGCCQNDNSFTNITDKQLWWDHLASSQTLGDFKFDLHVPAGTYQAIFNSSIPVAVGADVRYIYGQGALLATVDSTAAAGGQHLPYTYTANLAVGSNNTLSFYNAGIGRQTNDTGDISSISIQAIASQPGVTSPPRPGVLLGRKHHHGGRDRQDAFFAMENKRP